MTADASQPPTTPGTSAPGIQILAKPIGPICDIRCDYCFYLEKRALFDAQEQYRMPDELLAAYIRQYVEAQPTPVVEFVWHGGEPTLLGIDFFRRVLELQAPYRGRKEIRNHLQTNGLRLDDNWCAFFKANDFLIGISLDGPQGVHDLYRKDPQGRGTFERAMQGLRLLQKHRVKFNVLACVARETARHPLEVYRFFKDTGIQYVQFSPVVERLPEAETEARGLRLAPPAALEQAEPNTRVTPWTVEPEGYGDFLIAIYEEWVRQDVGRVFVMNFEWALTAWLGEPSPVCVFAPQCGRAVALEHDGSLFACDHYVYPEYRLGNLLADDLGQMVEASVAAGFGPHKASTLPRYCRECEVRNALLGRLPQTPLRPHAGRRAGPALSLPGLPKVLPPYPQISAGDGHLVGERPAGIIRYGGGKRAAYGAGRRKTALTRAAAGPDFRHNPKRGERLPLPGCRIAERQKRR